ncbi:hypothetical protein GOQ27_05850 [Clostridium sp. D2Q-11]|uniref:LiaI-LiaF-like transmembrane region domain-containing protein n=1 Tax=Anaeromonas frigoriresistens TaxID=2683708 RepID=A0A942UU13_9FIRM|nr:DUF5668 domain-containing protein [Anaeromonas frigoriresistens]MBS4537975.1 hypothetical protein [Anaeromonas frigoriresistens]
MKVKKTGINTLAITLISIGIMSLLKNFIDFNVWKIVSMTWPLIIIFFGLEIIITKLIVSKSEDEMKMTISVGSVVLLVLILITMSVSSGISRLNINIGDGLFDFYKYNSSFEKEYNRGHEGGFEKIDIKNSFGDVSVKSHSESNIYIKAFINIKNNDEEYAEEIANELVSISDSNRILDIITKTEDYRTNKSLINNIEVNLEILVPKGVEVKILDKFGDVEVADIDNKLQVENKHGDVVVNNIQGDINVENSFGEIDLESVKGKLDLINKHGDIKVYINDKINSDINIRNQFGDITMDIDNKQEGKFIANVKFGSIDTNFDLKIEEEVNSQRINDIKGDDSIIIQLDNSHGDIDIN